MEAEAVQAGVTIVAPILPPESDGLLLQAIIEPGDKTKEGMLVRAVALPWFDILKGIQRDPDFLYQFARHPRVFEEFIAGCYHRAGYEDVILTPRSRDGGIDVLATLTYPGVGIVRFIDQVKAYSAGRVVPAEEVRALAGVLQNRPDSHKGIVTTTSKFAPDVYKEFPDTGRIFLKDHDKLVDWLKELWGQRPT